MPKGFQPGDPRARAAGVRGGKASAKVRFRKAIDRIRALFPDALPPGVATIVWEYGEVRYRSGLQARGRGKRDELPTDH